MFSIFEKKKKKHHELLVKYKTFQKKCRVLVPLFIYIYMVITLDKRAIGGGKSNHQYSTTLCDLKNVSSSNWTNFFCCNSNVW